MSINDSLGDRMKYYEYVKRNYLTPKIPAIMRLDGRAFHTLTKQCKKPFDDDFNNTMVETAKELIKEIQGAKLAYIQSDEISVLILDTDRIESEGWFKYNIQKMVSISSALASTVFTRIFNHTTTKYKYALFDSRVFSIPENDINNYFIWRQQDWIRNSLSMLCQANFSQNELQGKKRNEQHNLLHSKGINWFNLESKWKNGIVLYKNSGGDIKTNSEIIFKDFNDILNNGGDFNTILLNIK